MTRTATRRFFYTPNDPHAAAMIGATLDISDVVTITATDPDDSFHLLTPARPFTTDKDGLVAINPLTKEYA